MEQLPGSLEDLQPQDLSTSSIPSVIDLTRKGEECVLSSTSLDALRVVKSPNWYPNSETGSSDTTLQSGDPVQPNNAFSHTTVTLSYVSRSHVFSTLDSLSRHSPLYGGPPIGKLSLHPPCDLDKGLGEMASLNQHYLEQVDGPMDLATQSELLQSLSQARAGLEDDGGARLTQEPEEVRFEVSSSDVKGKEEKSGALENGQGDSLSSGEGRGPPLDEEGCGSEELLLVSKKEDGMAARDREYISHLEDPISPSATSLDNVDDVFILPQASSSPSGDNSYLETFDEVPWEGLRTEGAIQPDSGISSSRVTTRFNSSAENKRRVHRGKAASVPLIDLTDDACVSNVSENNSVIPHMNGNAKVLQRTPKIKKLPARSGRGTRLETIVMSINSSKYKMSGCMQTNKKANASQPTASDSKWNDSHSAGRRSTRGRAPFSVKTVKDKAVILTKRGKTNNIHHDSCNHSTSDSEINNSKTSNGTPPKKPQFSVHKKSKKEPEHPDPSVDIHITSCPPPTPSECPKKGKGKATGSKTSPSVKTKVAGPTKRRQKKQRWIHTPSMFAPKEPEIRLKYVNYKEEKRNYSLDSFSPFVRVERQQSSSSLCTIINYPEQVRTQHKKGQQQQQAHPSGFLSAVVPSSSCLQLGRVSMHSQHQRALVCCLCGQAANAMDLGDLHGPYYPEGYQPSTQRPASTSGLKDDEDDSDTDSLSCSVRGRGRKCLAPSAPRPLRQKGHPESYRRTADGTGRRAAKRTWLVAGSADMEDWYSPPLLPLEPCEYWLHEDCAIWSAGVFLVKGKVYGLEEAVKVAQETMCSKCSEPGATLGCFFKGCPNKYHYRCALETDCVLIEENFSMKCKKHKNKAFKAPPGTRWDNR